MSKQPPFNEKTASNNAASTTQKLQILSPISLINPTRKQSTEQHDVKQTEINAITNDGVELLNINSSFSATDNSRCLKVHRKLGAIENMYFQYSKQGAETICLMFQLKTDYNITPNLAELAFILLNKRHPLLRSSITTVLGPPNLNQYNLVQVTPAFYDFLVVKRGKWLDVLLDEAAVKFDDRRFPLFRCRLLISKEDTENRPKESTSPGDKPFTSRFLFIAHHSVMDGGYIMWVFQDFVTFMDAIATERNISTIPELPFLPQVESVLTFPSAIESAILTNNESSYQTSFSIKVCDDASNSQVLLDYNKKFADNIQTFSSEPRNGCLTFKMSESETLAFSKACRSHGCKPKGPLVTASIMALLELIYGQFGDVEIPLEYIVDFRRFCNFPALGTEVPNFTGVAALHVPMLATFRRQTGPVSGQEFWDISKIVEDFLVTSISSRRTYDFLQSIIQRDRENSIPTTEKGKAPYVLSISNMGICDAGLNADLRQRVHLADLHGHSTVLVDDMPLFFMTTFLVNNQLCGNSSYCQEYTSKTTCEQFINMLRKYLTIHSKL
ncbi:uncharacterized protein LOC127882155 [Dreissena polymorpha]|uniref:Condensation domain-containing protein n=1 Tax=Dreissena polymorpha TaxID=45954 RepID=A0A9D4GKN3_DREPO|nr:uncharacterized protein LOC127882155 [Dreissena polymorpha]XP_052286582.1 uncharacterized protein LOC127882155 [Dreissena polymorpha]XP_052286583.1 uncharacterized protein LOC127882155 [Dreissena polymorpha]XP_052286584.1 uncharacterized protein LOC127882155 [Dreissena polymorpha]KAH3817184.1 hypothetical protein DPMN_118714 [Dreissena polymorpha]